MPIRPFNAIYTAKPDYLEELCRELNDQPEIIGNLVFSTVKKSDVCFALDAWLEPKLVSFQSISEAVRILRQAGKFWFLNPIETIRRSHLILAELRKLPTLTHTFPIMDAIPPIGCFSLLDQNTLVYSALRWKKPPLGDFQFIEDKKNPPNRAYLKLWEALSLLEVHPKSGELVIDLGASPGGWSYVCQSLGARVIAIDKAELEPRIATLPRIEYRRESAFGLDPKTISEPVDWLLSDVACYPDRLFELAKKWIDSGKAKRLIFTIKLQGETNLAEIQQFQTIPGARVLHLFHNKHEATFFYPAPVNLSPDWI
ncbi:MAG: SAM-dependent methyltransferase [Gammaproteobacteria bacterium]